MRTVAPLLPLPPTLTRMLERTIARTWWPLQGLDADDLRQEALLAYWQAAQRYEAGHGAQLRTYGSYRLLGRVQDVMRETTHRGAVRYVSLPDPWERRPATGDDWRRLRQTVNALPARLRLIVIRSYWSGWPLARIARHLGCSEPWVAQLRQRALHQVRQALAAPSCPPPGVGESPQPQPLA